MGEYREESNERHWQIRSGRLNFAGACRALAHHNSAAFNTREEVTVPLKGQLTHFVPQPEINYQTMGGGPGAGPDQGAIGIHMMPRSDGIALGGTSERGNWTLEPNEEALRRIVDAPARQ